jgi:hypothetical protein
MNFDYNEALTAIYATYFYRGSAFFNRYFNSFFWTATRFYVQTAQSKHTPMTPVNENFNSVFTLEVIN